jgi:hypothetical protein
MFGLDYDLYAYFKGLKDDDDLLKYFNFGYPDKRIAEQGNNIFIGLSEAKPYKTTHNSQTYTELVDFIITSKTTDYVETSKIYRSVVNRILAYLRENRDYEDRMEVVSFIPKYYSNELKFAELLINFKSVEEFNISDDDIVEVTRIINTKISEKE